MKKIIKIALSLVVAAAMTACGGNKNGEKGDAAQGGKVTIDGSSTVYELTEAVSEGFGEESPETKVIVKFVGTGGGFAKFQNGEIDICDASRTIKDEEKAACEKNGIKYSELMVAYDGITIVVNPKNTWANDITTEELKKLWEPAAKGKVTKWSDIRKGWPEKEIKLFGPGTSSGTFEFFTEKIVGEKNSSRNDFSPSEDDNTLVENVSKDEFALGYFGYAYYVSNKTKLKALKVDGIEVNEKTIKDKSYKPLGRPLFIYVAEKAAKRPEVVSFVNYYLNNMKQNAPEVGYVALTDEEIKTQKETFEAFCKSLAK